MQRLDAGGGASRRPHRSSCHVLRFIARRLLLASRSCSGSCWPRSRSPACIPGDPCRAALGSGPPTRSATPSTSAYGLNEPIVAQFGVYMGDVAHRRPRRLDPAAPAGHRPAGRAAAGHAASCRSPRCCWRCWSACRSGCSPAYRHNSTTDVATMVGANVGVSMPVFWLGLMLQYLFAVQLKDTVRRCRPRASSSRRHDPRRRSTSSGAGRERRRSSSSPTSTCSTPCSSGTGTSSWTPSST